MEENKVLKKVGHISDAHGIRGEVYIIVSSGDASWVNELKEITLKLSSKSQTYKVLKAKPYKKGFICTLDKMTNRNESEAVRRFEVWVDSDLFISTDGDLPFLSELLEFSVQDKTLGEIGKIKEFSSNGLQDLLVLDQSVNEQPIEIPFIKEFVLDVDYKNRIIKTDLPEGLVQINEKD